MTYADGYVNDNQRKEKSMSAMNLDKSSEISRKMNSIAPSLTLISSDTDLLAAAEAENLPIDNPFQHPETDSQSTPRHPITLRHFSSL
jgi:hypothetical protein